MQNRSRLVVIASVMTQVLPTFRANQMWPRSELFLRTLVGAFEMMKKRGFGQMRRAAFGTFLADVQAVRAASGAGVEPIGEFSRE
jgi:hypothetical protein